MAMSQWVNFEGHLLKLDWSCRQISAFAVWAQMATTPSNTPSSWRQPWTRAKSSKRLMADRKTQTGSHMVLWSHLFTSSSRFQSVDVISYELQGELGFVLTCVLLGQPGLVCIFKFEPIRDVVRPCQPTFC